MLADQLCCPSGQVQQMQFDGLRRREFITLLGSAAAGWPLAARAQQRAMPVLGILGSASAATYTNIVTALRKGLNEAGYVEGSNLLVESRWAEFQYERLPALAGELVKRPVDVIFSTGSVVSALAAKSATNSIPIVFANGSDPVQYRLVASLNRPGGNITGITFINAELGPKRLQLLRLLNPKTATIAVLVNPKNPNAADAKTFEAAGKALGVEIVIVQASTQAELIEAFAQAVQHRADALLVHVDALFNDVGETQIVVLAAQNRLPTMMANEDFPARGGLISYGANTGDLNQQAGVYVGRILRGEKPADLPVVQPTTFALRVNLRTAKALGLSIPESFLLLADDVIE
jgi:putative tryptophan/tyrosine transport system substrate-binding protein